MDKKKYNIKRVKERRIMNEIIITMLITSGVLFICGGIALWVFVDWLENNGEDQ